MEKRNMNKKKGFTLIELVVVIAIIGILATVITPRVRQALLKARDGRAIATLDALRTASNVYFAERGTVLKGNFATGTNSLITVGDILGIKNAGYLDEKSVKALSPTGAITGNALDDNASIEVGSLATETLCLAGTFTTGRLGFNFDTDGVGINYTVNATAPQYDASCKPWSDK